MSRTTHDETEARLRELLREADPAAGDALTPEEVRALRRTTLAAGEEMERRRWQLPFAGPLPASTLFAAAALTLLAAVALWRLLPMLPELPFPEVILSAAKDLGGRKEQVGKKPGEAGTAGEAATIVSAAAGREHGVAVRRFPLGQAAATARSEPPSVAPSPVSEAAAPQMAASFLTQPVFGAPEPTAPTEAGPLVPESTAAAAEEPEMASASAEPEKAPGLQLQFSAPGGTRIIWTLSPAAPAPSQS